MNPEELSAKELYLVKFALTYYRLACFPMGKSTYGNPISRQDRQDWAVLGMEVWHKFHPKEEGYK